VSYGVSVCSPADAGTKVYRWAPEAIYMNDLSKVAYSTQDSVVIYPLKLQANLYRYSFENCTLKFISRDRLINAMVKTRKWALDYLWLLMSLDTV